MAFDRITEQSSLYNDLEKKSVEDIVTEINQEDHRIADAVQATLPQVSSFISETLPRMKRGGRLFYLGAGTSGRLGVLDASEIPPTYGMPPSVVIGFIAGGDTALRNPVERAEDDEVAGWLELKSRGLNSNDSVVGIAASGTTPYVIGALRRCREEGILTACITSNPGAPITEVCKYPIVTVVGPEYVTGSSRMKSGTAQKLVLNMISTALMIKLGRVKGNRMVNMQLSNEKLIDRGTRMLIEELGLDYSRAKALLLTHGSAKKAIDAFHEASKTE